MSERVRIDVEGSIGFVTLTRAERHNGMDFLMLEEINASIGRVRKLRDLRTVIIRGEGPSFCAGLDFKTVMAQPLKAALGYAKLWSLGRNAFQRWSMGWRDLPLPVIAAIHGNCFGAGIQLALGADIRISTADARISVMEAKWGLIPDMGGGALLREVLPIDVAKELVMTGRIISGSEAHELGLVTHISADPVAKARELAAEIETRSPDAVAAGKFLLQSAWDGSERAALSAERRWQRRLMGSANQRIAVQKNMKKEDLSFGPRRIKG